MATAYTLTLCPRALFEWAAANSNLSVLEAAFPYEDRETLEHLMNNTELVEYGGIVEVSRSVD